MTKTGYQNFTSLKYVPKKTEVLTEYKVTPSKGFAFNDVINSIAGESSIGTWTSVSTMRKNIFKNLSPHIYSINRKTGVIKISYPLNLFEKNSVPEILSSIGGNIFGMKSIKGLLWKDVTFPEKMLKSFKGPRFGIPGVRKRLGIKSRPLVGTIVKPKVGLTSSQHAEVAYKSWKIGRAHV